MQLNVTSEGKGVALVSFATNTLDINSAQDFRNAIKPVIDSHATILIDMGALSFVDSSGLGALISVLRGLKDKEGDLRLFNMTNPVQSLFHLVRMHRVFLIFKTREDAMKGLIGD